MTSRQSLFDSIIVALGATLVSVGVAVFAAYSLSRMAFRGRVSYLNWVLGQRFMPPVAIVVPLVLIYRDFGMRDVNNIYLGYLGLILIYALMNLPIVLLLMKSFFDDVPKDVDEAAMIDGATRWQVFWKVVHAHGEGRCRGLCGALLRLRLDRVPDLADAHHRHPHGSRQDFHLRHFHRQ